MINLHNYFGRGTVSGSKESIWAQIVFFFKVGSGQFIEMSDTRASFQGRIETDFYKGDLSLMFEVLEGGKATFRINGAQADRATYSVSGNQLKVEAWFGNKMETITISQGGQGGVETYLGLSGAYNYNVHLAPATVVTLAA